MRTPLFLLAALLVTLGAGCTPPVIERVQQVSPVTVPTTSARDAAALAQPANGRIVLRETPKQGGRIAIAFALNDVVGKPLVPARLSDVGDRKLDVVLVREDQKVFRRLSPKFSDEAWRVATDVPDGYYFLYADFTPLDGAREALRVPLKIGKTLPPEFWQPGEEQTVDGDVTAQLERSLVTYGFTLRQAGAAPKDVRPLSGAYGHLFLFEHGSPKVYLHAIAKEPPSDGKIAFTAYAPDAGRYTAYALFDVGGTIRTFSYTFEIKALRDE